MSDDDHALTAKWFEQSIRQAQGGDRQMAEHLISAFAALAADPHVFDHVGGVPSALTKYIATCLADWQKRNFRDAETWFHVAKEAHAPDQTSGQHVGAMRAFLLLRGRGKGVQLAYAGAAAYSGLTEDQVIYLIQSDKPERAAWFDGRALGIVEAAALMGINKRLHNLVLNPPRKKYQRSR